VPNRTPPSRPRPRRPLRRTALAGLLLASLIAALLPAIPAAAYKPYTHTWTASSAYDDAVDDCQVTIDDAEYPVIPEVCAAIDQFPAYYNAGVIGPDGFPDLAFGQSVIHPEYTGKWLRHLYDAAWERWDAAPGTAESQQILAFTYGFLTHAAGDLWAHTLVNEFADGVFPGVFDMIEEVQNGEVEADGERQLTEIALRHIIVEGYIGDATPGYDGNDDRTLVPGEVNEDGDPEVSDDATPGTDFAMPTEFLYDLLIDPANPLPVGRCGDGLDDDADGTADDGCPGGPFTVGEGPEPKRGPLIDHFLDLQADLQVKQAEFDADEAFEDCLDADPDCYTVDESDDQGAGSPLTLAVQTVRGVRQTSIDVNRCIGAEYFCVADPVDFADDAIINDIGSAYLGAWIDDIEAGLHEWPRLGLEITNLLFDARTYREAQDWTCRNGLVDDDEHEGNSGDITSGSRANCEDGVGFGQVLLYAIGGLGAPNDTYLTDHLLSMLGAPDFVGDGFEIAGDVLDFLLSILQTIIPNFDFLSDFFEEIKDLLLDGLSAALGFDVEVLFNFLKHPTYWLDQQSLSITLPFGIDASADLFPADAREKLDELMGLDDPLETDNSVELPDGTVVQATKLKDDAEWSLDDFDVAFNAVQLSKMVLLDGDALNDVIKDQLQGSTVVKPTATIATYDDGPVGSAPANVMIDPLSGTDPWLVSIDADHGWRQDAQPINVIRDPGVLHGGNGTFPLWESCVARPAFRSLFRDWEPDTAGAGGTDANFGDLGDATSYDPTSTAAATSIAYGGSQAVVGGVQFLGIDHSVTVSAVDPVFTDEHVAIHYRAYPVGEAPGDWSTEHDASVTFSLDPAFTDGPHVIEFQTTNPCTTVAASGTTAEVVIDETAPTVTVTAPADGAVFDVNTTSPVSATHTDAGAGVDVSTVVFAFDGSELTLPHTLDTFFLAAGFHTVTSAATDKVGNVGSDTNTFEVRPTSAGMLSVLDRARSLNLITKNDVLRALKDTLTISSRSHQRGKHPTEWNALDATLSQLASQRGKAIDVVFADRMSGWIRWLLAYEKP
jgi:hypothetical protein